MSSSGSGGRLIASGLMAASAFVLAWLAFRLNLSRSLSNASLSNTSPSNSALFGALSGFLNAL